MIAWRRARSRRAMRRARVNERQRLVRAVGFAVSRGAASGPAPVRAGAPSGHYGRRPRRVWTETLWLPLRVYSTETKTGNWTTTTISAVQGRLRELDHPVRLRLLRSVARGPQTTARLAETWSLTAPEVSRHLAILRDAAIITSVRRGRYVHYELDLAANARLRTDLIEPLLP